MFKPNETVLFDRSLKVTFLRDLGDGNAVVRVGVDTRAVLVSSLSREGQD